MLGSYIRVWLSRLPPRPPLPWPTLGFSNRIVVLYPKMSTRGRTPQLKSGCFDGYGQTGADYDLKSGPQMAAMVAMVFSLLGPGAVLGQY